jgi:hypothetical protein
MSGFWPILITAMLAAALLAPVVPLSEVMAVEGSARYGLDYGRIRLWASLSFLAGNVLAGALLEVIPVSAVILLIAARRRWGRSSPCCCRMIRRPAPRSMNRSGLRRSSRW